MSARRTPLRASSRARSLHLLLTTVALSACAGGSTAPRDADLPFAVTVTTPTGSRTYNSGMATFTHDGGGVSASVVTSEGQTIIVGSPFFGGNNVLGLMRSIGDGSATVSTSFAVSARELQGRVTLLQRADGNVNGTVDVRDSRTRITATFTARPE